MARRSTDLLQEESHVYYLHHDYLGNLTEVTDEQQNIIGRARYVHSADAPGCYANAFGRILSNTIPTSGTHRLYAYSIQDPATGLYKISARWHDPGIGLWLTPGSIVPDVNNPITWNPYAFNYQNPANFVDPSGHFPIWDLLDIGSFVWSGIEFFCAPSSWTPRRPR